MLTLFNLKQYLIHLNARLRCWLWESCEKCSSVNWFAMFHAFITRYVPCWTRLFGRKGWGKPRYLRIIRLVVLPCGKIAAPASSRQTAFLLFNDYSPGFLTDAASHVHCCFISLLLEGSRSISENRVPISFIRIKRVLIVKMFPTSVTKWAAWRNLPAPFVIIWRVV